MEATIIQITDDASGQKLIVAAATARRRRTHGRSKMPKQKSGGQGQLCVVDDHAYQGPVSETTAGRSLMSHSDDTMKYVACVDGNIKLVAGTTEKIAHEMVGTAEKIAHEMAGTAEKIAHEMAGTAEKIAHEITEATKEISRSISDAVTTITLGIVSLYVYLFGYFGALVACYCLQDTMKSAGWLGGLGFLVILLAGIGPGMFLTYLTIKRRNN